MIKLSLTAARAVMLYAQGLLHPPKTPATKDSVLEVIRRMGALQIDTIHVVARSPYLVLWSRLGAYSPAWLDELLAEGRLFEFWAHAACWLPIEDFPLYRRSMLEGSHGWWANPRWMEEHAGVVEQVMERITNGGPARSSDFEARNGKGGTWWDWKEEKIALEQLFNNGRLMIARREKFQRVYDLTERVYPDWDDAAALPVEEARRRMVEKTFTALGLALPGWAADYYRLSKTSVRGILTELVETGWLIPVEVEGLPGSPAYAPSQMLPVIEDAAAGRWMPSLTTLLSPFDPLVWDRARARTLFGFDYTIEVYTPAPKRRYGYFTLPVLHNGALVGRVDPKAHRKEGVFELRAVHLEPGIQPEPELAAALAACLRECAEWHATPHVLVQRCDPPELLPLLQAALEGSE